MQKSQIQLSSDASRYFARKRLQRLQRITDRGRRVEAPAQWVNMPQIH